MSIYYQGQVTSTSLEFRSIYIPHFLEINLNSLTFCTKISISPSIISDSSKKAKNWCGTTPTVGPCSSGGKKLQCYGPNCPSLLALTCLDNGVFSL